MEREKTINFVGSVIIFFILLFVYSKWGPSLPISVLTQTKGEPLMVTETGKVAVVPDIAKVTIGIEEQGATLKQVQNSVNTKSKGLTDELKKLKIDEKDIKTVNYSVYPEYDYDSSPYKINGYRVSTSYEVKITDFEKINDVLVLATDSGANVVGNISFEVNEKTKEELTNKARDEAVEKAKNKAKDLAKSAGISLGKIINVSESGGISPRTMVMYDKAVTASEPETANIEAGETEIEVTVTLSYEIR
ncbi:MAG TPA: SIMPL domain-containing protein [Patescibacteria group bacterium]|nr:SIMPL domain-containing protein [Patescibacteria group bacterium]